MVMVLDENKGWRVSAFETSTGRGSDGVPLRAHDEESLANFRTDHEKHR